MHPVDYIIFGLYMAGVLGVGYYHFRKNKNNEDYYVGSRSMKAPHVGLSIAATDVGGGFSIGLGGLGFAMGLSGTWLLFTGLVGAWLAAVLVIPRIKKIDADMFTYPDFLRTKFDEKTALLAALISGIGYLGFTGAQVLAGAKLASGTVLTSAPAGISPLVFSLIVIAVITILYTVIGGIKAVIYTDTFQWIILMSGLMLVAVPAAVIKIGGFGVLAESLPPEFFTLSNIKPAVFINWMVTIIPIWFVAMTLYQRMFACRNKKEAQKAWFIAGLFEYPIMAFTGVFLGMCARVVFPEVEAEMGLPLLIKTVLPIGVAGLVIAAYFSAIMSTADSCLMASSGNFVNDFIQRHFLKSNKKEKTLIRLSRLFTLLIGAAAIIIAISFETVLSAILYAYSFMVSGLFIPTLGALFWKRSSSAGAFTGMLSGGLFTVLAQAGVLTLPAFIQNTGLDATLFGITISAVFFITFSLAFPSKKTSGAS
ncbi:MAG TPA: sodium:solute symporter family protein [Firmicutes bacterium]|nr:sodium:solute symporter family protein [Bacillota bacterium]